MIVKRSMQRSLVAVVAATACIVAIPPMRATRVERAPLQPVAAIRVIVGIGTDDHEPVPMKAMMAEVVMTECVMVPEVMETGCKVMATAHMEVPASSACLRRLERARESQERESGYARSYKLPGHLLPPLFALAGLMTRARRDDVVFVSGP